MRYILSIISWRDWISLNLWRQDEKKAKSDYRERKREEEKEGERETNNQKIQFHLEPGCQPRFWTNMPLFSDVNSNCPLSLLTGHGEIWLPKLRMKKGHLAEYPVCQESKQVQRFWNQYSRKRKNSHDVWVQPTLKRQSSLSLHIIVF